MQREPRQPQVVFLGEAMLDLICEQAAGEPADVEQFTPHLGGAAANAAVAAARLGAAAALCGGVGDDAWGGWLRAGLEQAGVATSWLEAAAGCATQLALIVVDERGEPRFTTYGDSVKAIERGLRRHLSGALQDASALYLTSHCLRSPAQRRLVRRAYEYALTHAVPIVFDLNWRPERWPGHASRGVGDFASGAALLKVTDEEARALTGERELEAAAAALLAGGARVVLITLGAGGALVGSAGAIELVATTPVDVRCSVGAGDGLIGALLARLAGSSCDFDAVLDALPEAMAVAADATQRWGAVA